MPSRVDVGPYQGAQTVPCASVLEDDGTFMRADELRDRSASKGATADQAVGTDCRVGDRSAIAWVVLIEPHGCEAVEDDLGFWTERDTLIRAPFATGEAD